VENALGKLYAGRISFYIPSMFSKRPIQLKTADDLVRTRQNWIALPGDHRVEQHVHNIVVTRQTE
jgi:myo-inositol 2-dehydrogenase / D-chiro-inositol 1-dehydrogenase